jgi:hypothetical protein
MPAPAHIFTAQAIIAAQGVEDGLAEFGRRTPALVDAILLAAKVSGLVRGVMRLPGEGHAGTFAKACWGMAHKMGAFDATSTSVGIPI